MEIEYTMEFLNLFCKVSKFMLIIPGFFIFIDIIRKINEIDYIRKKILLIQIIFLVLTVCSIYYFNIKFTDFIITTILMIILPFDLLIYAEYIRDPHL